jgi:hypothetical protein
MSGEAQEKHSFSCILSLPIQKYPSRSSRSLGRLPLGWSIKTLTPLFIGRRIHLSSCIPLSQNIERRRGTSWHIAVSWQRDGGCVTLPAHECPGKNDQQDDPKEDTPTQQKYHISTPTISRHHSRPFFPFERSSNHALRSYIHHNKRIYHHATQRGFHPRYTRGINSSHALTRRKGEICLSKGEWTPPWVRIVFSCKLDRSFHVSSSASRTLFCVDCSRTITTGRAVACKMRSETVPIVRCRESTSRCSCGLWDVRSPWSYSRLLVKSTEGIFSGSMRERRRREVPKPLLVEERAR